jgi:hypothetical protein
VQRLLYTGVLATLFPFIRVTSTYLPSPPPLPAPIVSPNHLPSITRKQLIDALSKFSTSSPQSLYTEGLIFEVIVEYIGRRWRSGESDIVENIARKLTEIEFEVRTGVESGADDRSKSKATCRRSRRPSNPHFRKLDSTSVSYPLLSSSSDLTRCRVLPFLNPIEFDPTQTD